MIEGKAHAEAFVIEPDGRIHDLKKAREKPTLEELQKAVGGYIETVQLPRRQGLLMIVNEEGLIHELAFNHRASALAHQDIVGPVVVLSRYLLD